MITIWSRYFILPIFSICFSTAIFSQSDSAANGMPKRWSVTTNVLSHGVGNRNFNVSLNRTISEGKQIEFEALYFYKTYIPRLEDNQVNRFDIDVNYGLGFHFIYKKISKIKKNSQNYLGGLIGYRHIAYTLSRLRCTAATIQNHSFCVCEQTEKESVNNTSMGIPIALVLGSESKKTGFYWGFQFAIGVITYLPSAEDVQAHVSCNFLEDDLSDLENALRKKTGRYWTNHSIQFGEKVKPFLLIQLKFGYAF